MVDPAQVELHKEALLQLSRDWFWILEFAFLAITGLLASFIVRKRVRSGVSAMPRPMEFAMLMVLMFGAVAVFTKLWGYNHFIFAFGFGACIALSIVDPVAAVAFLIANSLIRPWEMSDVAEMSFLPKTLFLLAIGSWVVHSVRARRLTLLMNGTSRLFYAVAVWFLISALTSGDFMEGLTKYSGNVMIAAIVFVLVSNAPHEDEDVVLLRRTFVVAVCGLILHAILVTTSQQDYDPTLFRLEDAGTVGNSNDLASLITVAVPFVAIPSLMGKGRRAKWAGKLTVLMAILLLFAGLSASQSRGAILSLALGAIGFGVVRARNKALAMVAAAFCVVAVFAGSSLLTFSREADDLEGSTKSRMAFMMAGVNMGLHHPLLGIGHDGFATAWDGYAVGETFESGVRSGHSSWLIAFAENGFPGLLLLIALFVSAFRKAMSVQFEHPELVCAMVSYGVAMTFLNHAYTIYPYLLFAMILAAAKIQAKGVPVKLTPKGQPAP